LAIFRQLAILAISGGYFWQRTMVGEVLETVLATESYLFFHSCIHICISVKESSGLD
jgi:hypothetical protein